VPVVVVVVVVNGNGSCIHLLSSHEGISIHPFITHAIKDNAAINVVLVPIGVVVPVAIVVPIAVVVQMPVAVVVPIAVVVSIAVVVPAAIMVPIAIVVPVAVMIPVAVVVPVAVVGPVIVGMSTSCFYPYGPSKMKIMLILNFAIACYQQSLMISEQRQSFVLFLKYTPL